MSSVVAFNEGMLTTAWFFTFALTFVCRKRQCKYIINSEEELCNLLLLNLLCTLLLTLDLYFCVTTVIGVTIFDAKIDDWH